jgi:hypothetical protein
MRTALDTKQNFIKSVQLVRKVLVEDKFFRQPDDTKQDMIRVLHQQLCNQYRLGDNTDGAIDAQLVFETVPSVRAESDDGRGVMRVVRQILTRAGHAVDALSDEQIRENHGAVVQSIERADRDRRNAPQRPQTPAQPDIEVRPFAESDTPNTPEEVHPRQSGNEVLNALINGDGQSDTQNHTGEADSATPSLRGRRFRNGGGQYNLESDTITLHTTSIMTFLHEFRHKLQNHFDVFTDLRRGKMEVDARSWSHSLFFWATPLIYTKSRNNKRFAHRLAVVMSIKSFSPWSDGDDGEIVDLCLIPDKFKKAIKEWAEEHMYNVEVPEQIALQDFPDFDDDAIDDITGDPILEPQGEDIPQGDGGAQ